MGRAGSGTIFFSGCNLLLRLLPELRHQPARSGAGGLRRRPGQDDADAAAHWLPQHQLRHAHARRPADPGGAGAGQSRAACTSLWSTTAADTIQWRRCGSWRASSTSTCPMQSLARTSLPLKYSRAPQYTRLHEVGHPGDAPPGGRPGAGRGRHRSAGALGPPPGPALRAQPAPLRSSAFSPEEISSNTYLNIMAQYRPEYNACSFPELSRPITGREYGDALRLAARAGLTRGLAIL